MASKSGMSVVERSFVASVIFVVWATSAGATADASPGQSMPGDGTYRVGVDILSGVHVTKGEQMVTLARGSATALWCRSEGRHRLQRVGGPTIVTIRRQTQHLKRCMVVGIRNRQENDSDSMSHMSWGTWLCTVTPSLVDGSLRNRRTDSQLSSSCRLTR